MQANPVSGSANADVLHRFVAAFNAKDEDALGKILTPDVVDHHLPPGLPAGIDGLKTWLGIVWAAFDAKLNLDDVVAAGDRVAAAGRSPAPTSANSTACPPAVESSPSRA